MQKKLARFSLFVLIYNIFVILFGAYVRASQSGAGCGAHWPSCQGEIIPINPIVETVIEFTHRITSGLALIFITLLVVFVFRWVKGKSKIKNAAILALVFTVLEALIGAGLVLFELVGDNDSIARAVIIALHLINTFMLLASLILVFEWTRFSEPDKFVFPKGTVFWSILLTVSVFLLAASGAITALGDTLFPSASFLEGMRQDATPGVHFLIQLRVYHPLIAILVGISIFFSLRYLAKITSNPKLYQYSVFLQILFLIQIFLGGLNVLLLAPIWMQIIHLLFADLIWLTYVLVLNQVAAIPGDSFASSPLRKSSNQPDYIRAGQVDSMPNK
ncbi:MAG: hypothetical protein BGO78_01065 [Chloroflexi bacterium 44-23]|nr:MAG: hypothetical protein BGO78_01065 [Chloroflexi bacterium 44-23]